MDSWVRKPSGFYTSFRGLGAQPLAGRYLLSSDDRSNIGVSVAVLSYDFARKRFGKDPGGVIGRKVIIESRPFLVAGVMRRGFLGLSADQGPDVWIPFETYIGLKPGISRDGETFVLAGRLKPGVSLAQVHAQCLTIWRNTMEEYYRGVEKIPPKRVAIMIQRGMQVSSFARGQSMLREDFKMVFEILMVAGGLMSLILAVNVSGILMARAIARGPETAVRLAVGASPLRFTRQWAQRV